MKTNNKMKIIPFLTFATIAAYNLFKNSNPTIKIILIIALGILTILNIFLIANIYKEKSKKIVTKKFMFLSSLVASLIILFFFVYYK